MIFSRVGVTANHVHYSYRKDLILFGQEKKYLHNWIVSFKNIKEYDVTGISHVKNSNNTKEIFRYSIDGKLLKAPTKGINIVKYSNGTVKKIIVQ